MCAKVRRCSANVLSKNTRCIQMFCRKLTPVLKKAICKRSILFSYMVLLCKIPHLYCQKPTCVLYKNIEKGHAYYKKNGRTRKITKPILAEHGNPFYRTGDPLLRNTRTLFTEHQNPFLQNTGTLFTEHRNLFLQNTGTLFTEHGTPFYRTQNPQRAAKKTWWGNCLTYTRIYIYI